MPSLRHQLSDAAFAAQTRNHDPLRTIGQRESRLQHNARKIRSRAV